MSPDLQIEVLWKLRQAWHAEALLRRVAATVAAAEGFRAGQVSIAVVGERAMAALHERSTGATGPTDVLTFDLGTSRRRRWLDGEIVICAAVARRRTLGRPLSAARAELALYLTHGLLHLAGYDDHAPSDFARMHAREDELLNQLGLGPVFARGARNR